MKSFNKVIKIAEYAQIHYIYFFRKVISSQKKIFPVLTIRFFTKIVHGNLMLIHLKHLG